MDKSLYVLIKEYSELSNSNNPIRIFKKWVIEGKLIRRAHHLELFELLKEFRILFLGLFSHRKKYSPSVRAYEFMGYNCLEINIKYNYIIKFNYNKNDTHILIEGSLSKEHSPLPLDKAPYDIEATLRRFIILELIDMMIYIEKSNRRYRHDKHETGK